MRGLGGKVALVTGATGGIGAVIADRLAAEGAKVVCTGRNREIGEQCAARIGENGGAAIFVRVDLGDEDEVRGSVSEAVAQFGRLDIVVNNAAATDAVVSGGNRRVTDETNEGFMRQIGINLIGPFWYFKYAIPAMIEAGGGSFVNISTLSAHKPVPGMPAYSCSKSALEALSRSVAIDYAADNIRSNCIVVGSIMHEATRARHEHPAGALMRKTQIVQRPGLPEDVAAMVAFLASGAESGFLSGETLPVHGGTLAKLVIPDISDLRQELYEAKERRTTGSTD